MHDFSRWRGGHGRNASIPINLDDTIRGLKGERTTEAMTNHTFSDRFQEVIAGPPVPRDEGALLGHSREGRPIRAFRFGEGPKAVSLLAGCHADEPVGPRLLRYLIGYFSTLPPNDPWLTDYQWWIVPHINPDGERRNAAWVEDGAEAYDLGRYLSAVVRELPGDDIEFGFPRSDDDQDARPENRAVSAWWRTCERPFVLHASLHGTGFAAGPWFLIEPAWRDRCGALKREMLARVEELGYTPHDVERLGEKGFVRLGPGFCTRPDSVSMGRHFLQRGDPETAARFRPSSMETIRSLGGDPLTLVSEMPLFITPGVGDHLGPPDPVALRWKERIAFWRSELQGSGSAEAVTERASAEGLISMPVLDQVKLQWAFVRAGLAAHLL